MNLPQKTQIFEIPLKLSLESSMSLESSKFSTKVPSKYPDNKKTSRLEKIVVQHRCTQ